jgi:hypothetical protein
LTGRDTGQRLPAIVSRSGLGVVLLGVVLLSALPAGVPAASPKPLPLSARLIERGEFRGFTVGAPTSYKTAKKWVAAGAHPGLTAAQARADVARLTREGFRELLTEFLGHGNGLSWVMQLGSPASARAELATEVREEKAQGQALEIFRVSAIPGAVGFGACVGNSGGENIVFADGSFLYLVGNGWSGSAHNPRRAALIGAATKLDKRVHGHPAG